MEEQGNLNALKIRSVGNLLLSQDNNTASAKPRPVNADLPSIYDGKLVAGEVKVDRFETGPKTDLPSFTSEQKQKYGYHEDIPEFRAPPIRSL